MSEPYNKLTPAQVERLALIAEEASEVAQAAMKILRHGYRRVVDGQIYENGEALEGELGDLRCALNLLSAAGDVDMERIMRASIAKRKILRTRLHHQDND